MTTVQDIITDCRNRTDMVNPTTGQVDAFFNDTTELIPYINASAGEMYDIIVQTYDDYNLSYTPNGLVITSSTQNYVALPSDFLKPRGVDIYLDSTQPYSVRPFNFQERNRYANTLFRGPTGPYNVKYRCQDGYLFIEPVSAAPGTYYLWYTPVFTNFTAVTDVLPSYMSNNSWSEYIVLDVCIKMQDKLQLDSTPYERKKEPLRQRILAMSRNYAQAEGKTVSSVRQEYDDLFGWYGSGGNGNY